MNKGLAAAALCLALTVSPAEAKQAYNPLIFNLSTLFDFNPVKGHIKSLHAETQDGNGRRFYRLDMAVARDGCVNALKLEDRSQGFSLAVNREGNELTGRYNNQPVVFTLNERCNLVSRKNGDELTEYQLYPNGRIKDVIFQGEKKAEHFYDRDWNLIKVEFYLSGKVSSSNQIYYPDTLRRPVDFTLVNRKVLSAGYTAASRCDYDPRLVPLTCHIEIKPGGDGKKEPERFTAITQVSFY